MNTFRNILAVVLAATGFAACAASPCDGVNRTLTTERKEALAPELAKQLHASKTEALQLFRVDGWSIIYVDTYQSDRAYLFYEHEPLTNPYVTLWSGAATRNEEQEIKDWAVKNAPGIPLKLASCFARHVTKDRDL